MSRDCDTAWFGSPLHLAAAAGDADEVRTLAERFPLEARDGRGRTALEVAAGCGHLGVVAVLVDRGARAGAGLRRAPSGDEEMAELLLAAGAKVYAHSIMCSRAARLWSEGRHPRQTERAAVVRALGEVDGFPEVLVGVVAGFIHV